MLQSCPHHVRGRFRQANRRVFEARHEAARSHDSVSEERAWKAFCILPMLFFRRPQGEGRVSKEELRRRCDLFAQGRWETLVGDAAACVSLPTPKRKNPTDMQKAKLACRKVRLGEVSRPRHCLTSSSDERWRTWRVDTRLAVLGIIHFRHLISESPAVKPYCLSSDALEVALWTQRWCSKGDRPHSPGIHHRSTFDPCLGAGTLASAPSHH